MAEQPFDARDERRFWEAAGLCRPDPAITFDRARWAASHSQRSLPSRRFVSTWGAAVGLLALMAAGSVLFWHPSPSHPTPSLSFVRGVLPHPSHTVVATVLGATVNPVGITRLDMPGPSEGFAVDASQRSELLTTSDGGLHWTPLYHAAESIIQVDFLSAQVGFLLTGSCNSQGSACAAHTLLQTRNGGRSWKRVHTFSRLVATLDAVTAKDLWAVSAATPSSRVALLRSTDGGTVWTVLSNPLQTSPAMAEALSFINARQGWLLAGQVAGAGSQGKSLYETQNGGTSWTTISAATFGGGKTSAVGKMPLSGYVQSLSGLVFVSAHRGYMALNRGGLFMTTDGGTDWTGIPQPAVGADSARVGFWSPMGGWLQEGFGPTSAVPLYLTQTGGTSWTRQYPPVVPTTLSPLTGQSLWLGFGDLWGNVSTRIQESPNAGQTWTSVARAPAGTQRLQFLSSTAWVAAGPGTAELTTDSGQTWLSISLPTLYFNEHTLTFANPRAGWVYVPHRGLYATTDGGRHWTLRSVHPLPFLPSHLVRTSPAIAYGIGPTRLGKPQVKTIPGTQGKTTVVTPAVTNYVWKSVNSGHTWVGTQIPSQYVEGLSFSGATGVVWSLHRYWVTEDGAAHWTARQWPSGWIVDSLSVVGKKTLVVTVGSATSAVAVQFLSTDGGAVWSPLSGR